MSHESRQRTLKYAVLAATSAAGIWIALSPPVAGLTVEAMRVLGVVVWGILNWVYGPFDDYVVGLMMLALFVLSRAVPFEVAFSVFGSSTWWLIVAAIGIGAAVQHSGLVKRIALKFILLMPETFLGQCIGLAVAGIVLSPTLATATGKAAIAGRFVLGMAQALDLPERGNHSAGLFFSMLLGFVLATPLYMTANLCGFVILGLLPQQYHVSWMTWFVQSIPLVLPLVVLVMVAIVVLFRPKGDAKIPRQYLLQELGSMGRLSRNEVKTGVILAVTLLLWVTEQFHHIDSTATAVVSFIMLIVTGTLDRKQIDHLPWSMLLFISSTLSLAIVLPATKVDSWFASVLTPRLSLVSAHPLLLLCALGLVVVALKFLIVSVNGVLSIVMVPMIPVALAAGIHPWVMGMVIFTIGQSVILLPYQNPIYLVAYNASEGRMSTHRQTALISIVALVASFLGVALGVLVWSHTGFITPVR